MSAELARHRARRRLVAILDDQPRARSAPATSRGYRGPAHVVGARGHRAGAGRLRACRGRAGHHSPGRPDLTSASVRPARRRGDGPPARDRVTGPVCPCPNDCLACGARQSRDSSSAPLRRGRRLGAPVPRGPWRLDAAGFMPPSPRLSLDEVAWWLGALVNAGGGLTNRIQVAFHAPTLRRRARSSRPGASPMSLRRPPSAPSADDLRDLR